MSRLGRALSLGLLLLLFGCADGGPVGTGISSVAGISGNISEVDVNGQVSGGTGVQVSVDGVASAHDVTDSNGSFEVKGDFSGPVTLHFVTAALSVDRQLDVPAGSSILLQDMKLSPQGVTEASRRVLGFFGQVALVDCQDGTVLVNDQRPPEHQFLVRVSADTVLARANGEAVTCADISPGNQLAAEGLIGLDRSIDAVAIILGPPHPGNPAPEQQVRLRGQIVLANCSTGMLLISDRSSLTRLRLTAMTTISNALGRPIGCDGLAHNDFIEGTGLINTRRPDVIEVQTLRKRPPPPQP